MLQSNLPTPDSIIFLIDEAGFIAASTAPGTLAWNDTLRHTPLDTNASAITVAGRTLLQQYGSYGAVPAATNLQFINVGRPQWLMGTSALTMPTTSQTYQLVLLTPRVDFYGATDAARVKSLVISCSVAAVGVGLTILLGYLATQPLNKLAMNMKQLTRFDFSALENGRLASSSIVAEIRDVEIAFRVMVGAFAGAVRKNKELHGGRSSIGALETSNGLS
ncbi:hypothetical protein HK101_011807 [Irineochytrium annulatum]|nr:hypothetical protein HK101_011807 [Irineochytrium annulatum]